MSILIPLFLATLIGLILGHNRQIGFWWVFFFSLFFGLIVGIAMGLASTPNKMLQEGKRPIQGLSSKIGGIILLIVSIVSFYISYEKLGETLYYILWTLSYGFFGASIYALRTSNRPFMKDEQYSNQRQVDGLIVLVITGVFLVYLQFEVNNIPFRIIM